MLYLVLLFYQVILFYLVKIVFTLVPMLIKKIMKFTYDNFTFYEKESKFFKLNDGESAPSDTKIYNIIFSDNMNSRSYVEFPQFNLKIKAEGYWGYRFGMSFIYAGLSFRPKWNKPMGDFVLEFLNELALGDIKNKILKLIEISYQEPQFTILKEICEDGYIDADEYIRLFNDRQEFYNIKSQNEKLLSEINILNEKLIIIKSKLDI